MDDSIEKSNDRYRPVVAMDIDGVLRLWALPGDPLPEGAYPADVVFRYETYPQVFHGAPEWDDDGEARDTFVLSELGAAWIRSLLDRNIEVVWATTWQHAANTVLAPVLGLPPLPVAVEGDKGGARTAAEWKAWQLADRFPGRPLVWVDDGPLPTPQLQRLRFPRDKALTLVHPVNPFEGISRDDIAEVEDWLTLASTRKGQEELRRRRRNERERDRRALERRLWGSTENARRRRRIVHHLQQEIGADYILANTIASYVARHPQIDRDELLEEIEQWGPGLGGLDLDHLLDAVQRMDSGGL